MRFESDLSPSMPVFELSVSFPTGWEKPYANLTTLPGITVLVCLSIVILVANTERDGIYSPCHGQNNPTLCSKDGRMQCLTDVTCDGVKDCPNGEDEANCGNETYYLQVFVCRLR